jgi:hypothetical protein
MLHVMSEDAHQAALFNWVRLALPKFPKLKLLHAIPNGGQRNKIVAAKLKAQGVQAGVPDLCLPVARHGFHGLYLEGKRPASAGVRAGTTSDSQDQWIANLREEGYRVQVFFGWQEAAKILTEYLS